MYTRKQVYESALNYFKGDDLAANVWTDKYALRDNNGSYYELTPDDMHHRLAKELARIENKYPDPLSEDMIYEFLRDFNAIVPQGGSMYGVGNDFVLSSLSNCFVIGNKVDSYGGICYIDQEQAQLMKRRGGVGHDLSHIRPRGFKVHNSALSSSGITPFAERYSHTTEEVAQNGRNGALMLSVDIDHPDAEEFIDMKMDTNKVTGANVSVKIYDDFMEAVVNEGTYWQKFANKKIAKKSAKPLFDKIIHNAWKSAEPGILFWDNVLNESPARGYGERFKETSTNPCGELPLPPYDSCRLLIVNLYSYVSGRFTDKPMLDQAKLFDTILIAQRLMDDIVDLEIEKIEQIIDKLENNDEPGYIKDIEISLWEEIRQMAIDGRRTGLGFTGFGDMLAALGIKYGSEQSINFTSDIQQFISSAAYISSVGMAKQRGSFPLWDYHKDQKSNFIKRMFSKDNFLLDKSVREAYRKTGRRNIGVLTIAPTGTSSIMTQTTSGIEPLFSARYKRKRKVGSKEIATYIDELGGMWEEFYVIHKPFVEWYSIYSKQSFKKSKEYLISLTDEEFNKVFELSPYFEATAQDVNYVNKVKMQGMAQKWVDHSISVTVNMPKHVTEDVVRDVYIQAWKSGCKGITVYREGSRMGILNLDKKSEDVVGFEYMHAIPRPKTVDVDVYFKKSLGDEYIMFVGLLDGKPLELFAVPYSKNFGIPRSVTKGTITKIESKYYRFVSDKGHVIENIIDHMNETEQNQTRDYSLMLRHRIDPVFISKSIDSYATISSFQRIVKRILETYIDKKDNQKCPQCGGVLVQAEGCVKCKDCGFSKCG